MTLKHIDGTANTVSWLFPEKPSRAAVRKTKTVSRNRDLKEAHSVFLELIALGRGCFFSLTGHTASPGSSLSAL